MPRDVGNDARELPPVPIRRGFVVALVIVVAVTVAPFASAMVFAESETVTVEPVTRIASAVAMFLGPIVAVFLGVRRGLVLRSAFIVAGAIMSLSCLALLIVITSTEALGQTIAAGAIAGTAMHAALRARPKVAPTIPARPDRSG